MITFPPLPHKLGNLFIVATPIGNLSDITFRAKEVLSSVDCIAAEDTRLIRKLLHFLAIEGKEIISYREENRERATVFLRARVAEGKNIALVSDAGTPVISDPGAYLVSELSKLGIPVVPIPGPSSVTAALAVSGFRADSFLFLGFLFRKKKKRQAQYQEIIASPRLVLCFETPHRILPSLSEMADAFGEREMVLCRELTKMHEEILRGTVGQIFKKMEGREKILGEFTLVISGLAAIKKKQTC